MKTTYGYGDLVPAFTLAECDTDPPSWAVNLSEFRIGHGNQAVIQIFHELDVALRFIEQNRGKIN